MHFRVPLKSALIIALALLAGSPGMLLAHAKLVSSDPAAGAILTSPPATIRLVFTEKPEIALSSVRLVGASGDTTRLVTLGNDASDDHVLVAQVPGALRDGKYRIVWRAAASDGHPSRGTIDFSVAITTVSAPRDSLPPEMTSRTEQEDDETMAVRGALGSIAARWLSLTATFLVIGVVAFRFLVLPRVARDYADAFSHIAATNAATLGIFASVGAILAAMVKLVRESSDMPDTALSGILFGSLWGMSLLLHIVASITALAAFALVHRAAEARRSGAWTIAAVASAALAVAPALGGHAAAGDRAWLAVPADVIHVAVGSIWIGTLAVIVLTGIPAAFKTPDDIRPGARVAAMVNAFSPIALACGGAVVATGLASSVLRLPAVNALWTTPYGIVLMLKLFFVAMLFGAGAWNWRRMKPRLTGEDAIAPLRSSATFELVLAGAVLAITAILVALELP